MNSIIGLKLGADREESGRLVSSDLQRQMIHKGNSAGTLPWKQNAKAWLWRGHWIGIVRLQLLDRPDDVGMWECAGARVGGHCENSTNSATEVNGEWRHVQHSKLSNLIGCIDGHLGLLDEREAKDGIDSDIWAGGNKKGSLLALTRQVGHGELEGIN
jgi:hypothetical protein